MQPSDTQNFWSALVCAVPKQTAGCQACAVLMEKEALAASSQLQVGASTVAVLLVCLSCCPAAVLLCATAGVLSPGAAQCSLPGVRCFGAEASSDVYEHLSFPCEGRTRCAYVSKALKRMWLRSMRCAHSNTVEHFAKDSFICDSVV